MIDRAKAFGIKPISPTSMQVGLSIEKHFSDAGEPVVFDITNVEEYYARTAKENWKIDEDFPMLMPPYPLMWMEHKVSKSWRMSWGQEEVTQRDAWYGYLSRRNEIDDIQSRMNKSEYESGWPEILQSSGKWLVEVVRYVEVPKGYLHGPLDGLIFAVDEDGSCATVDPSMWREEWKDGNALGVSDFAEYATPEEEELNRATPAFYHPWMLALAFLDCKNVYAEDNAPPQKVARRFKKKHGKEMVTYKTLTIEPMGVSRKTNAQGRTGELVGMHWARGHFKNYTAEKPLFGKWVGRYFWESQVRGSRSKGKIEKDYNVEAPKGG